MSTQMYDSEDNLNENPQAEHDEWQQAIKDDGTLKPVNERYRIKQRPAGWPLLWCGTCDIQVETTPTYTLAVFLEAAKEHEEEVHS